MLCGVTPGLRPGLISFVPSGLFSFGSSAALLGWWGCCVEFPRTASWANFVRPFGTFFVWVFSRPFWTFYRSFPGSNVPSPVKIRGRSGKQQAPRLAVLAGDDNFIEK